MTGGAYPGSVPREVRKRRKNLSGGGKRRITTIGFYQKGRPNGEAIRTLGVEMMELIGAINSY